MTSGTTSVHLTAEDFWQYLDERAAILTLSRALGCEATGKGVILAVKSLMDREECAREAIIPARQTISDP